MENPTAREQIPESWVEKSRCPYCSSAPLWIQHAADQPDYFVCPTCEMSFNIAQGEPSIFIRQDPVGAATGYEGRWVEMKTFIQATQVKNAAPKQEAVTKPEISTPVENADPKAVNDQPRDEIYRKYPAEVIDNAAELYTLGNSKTKIKDILLSYSHLSDEACDEILAYISRKRTGEKIRTFKAPRWALGCIIVPFLCLIMYGLMVFFQYQTASGVNADADPQTITIFKYENLPKFLQKLIPEEVQEVQMPLAVITKLESTGAELTACPADAEAAAALFGGQPSEWEYKNGQKAWALQSNYARILNIPERYLVVIPVLNRGLLIQLVPGPAKINNAYMLLVRCP